MKSFKSLLETNKTFRKIYTEEAVRFGKILKEYSADKIWNSMSEEEQWDALGATADDNGPDIADKWAGSKWDEIPADIQDSIDLGSYELASDDQFGRSMIRGVKSEMGTNPIAAKFVTAFLEKLGKKSIDDLSVEQASQLNSSMWNYVRSSSNTGSTPSNITINPRDTTGGEPSKNRDWRGGMWTGD